MAFPCPRCGDRYTQSLPMVYGTSMSVRNWRSRSGYSGVTTSQTLVGGLASPPVKRTVRWLLVWLLVVSAMLMVGREFAQEQHKVNAQARVPAMSRRAMVRHRDQVMRMPVTAHESSLTDAQWDRVAEVMGVLWVVAMLGGMGLLVRAIWWNWRVYPAVFAQWGRSYMCRGCGVVFLEP